MSDNTTRGAVIDALVHEVAPELRDKYRRVLDRRLPTDTALGLVDFFELATSSPTMNTYSTRTERSRAAKKLWLEPTPIGSERDWQSANPTHRGGAQ